MLLRWDQIEMNAGRDQLVGKGCITCSRWLCTYIELSLSLWTFFNFLVSKTPKVALDNLLKSIRCRKQRLIFAIGLLGVEREESESEIELTAVLMSDIVLLKFSCLDET